MLEADVPASFLLLPPSLWVSYLARIGDRLRGGPSLRPLAQALLHQDHKRSWKAGRLLDTMAVKQFSNLLLHKMGGRPLEAGAVNRLEVLDLCRNKAMLFLIDGFTCAATADALLEISIGGGCCGGCMVEKAGNQGTSTRRQCSHLLFPLQTLSSSPSLPSSLSSLSSS